MILTVTLNPSVDRLLIVEKARLCDTNRVMRTETDAGGKGVNLARVARELGAEVLAIGFLGGGPGAFVRSVLDREGVPHDFIEVPGETRMNVIIEHDDESAQETIFNERGPEIPQEQWEELLEKVSKLSPKASFVAVGGSIPPGLKPDAHQQIIKLAKSSKCKAVLDAEGDPLKFGLNEKPFLAKPNAREAEKLLIMPVRTKAQCLDAARKIHGMGVEIAIVSRGAAGAVMVDSEATYNGLAPQVRARSTIGSGDSMLGAMLWALEAKRSNPEAFAWGIAAGAATATTSGSEIGRKDTIEQLLPQVKIERMKE